MDFLRSICSRRRFIQKVGLAIISAVLIQLPVPQPGWGASEGRVRNVTVDIVNKEILVSADLVSGFNNEIADDIQNGISKDFYYYVLLKKKQKNWFDEELVSKTVRYHVKYDTLKKQYLVLQIEGAQVTHESIFNDFEAMKQKISRIERVKLAPVRMLNTRRRYYVSVKSQMKATKLPLRLETLLFFIPFLELDTPWADSPIISMPAQG